MLLSLKAELETWASALKAYDEKDLEKALKLFSHIADSSKILTNIGLIYATIGDHETAVEKFNSAINLDSYLAIAHFQCGVSNFLLERYGLALLKFEETHLFLRGNEAINYEQLGLNFKLFSAEVLFNKGLTKINLGLAQEGLADMQEASRHKVTDEHNVIYEAIRRRGQGYTVFSIPVGVLYRPPESKLRNSEGKNYLGKARLVAASDSSDAFTEFTGVKRFQRAFKTSSEIEEGEESIGSKSLLTRSATMAASRTDSIVTRSVTRSETTLQLGTVVHPDISSDRVLTSRRSPSVSNPANGPLPLALNMSGSNPILNRSEMTLLVKTGMNKTTSVAPLNLKVKTLEDSATGVAGVGAGYPRDGRSIEVAATGARNLRALQSLPSISDGKRTRRPTVHRMLRPVYDGENDNDDELGMAVIRVRLHYQDDVRGMTISPIMSFNEFNERVTTKLGTSLTGLRLKFTDEDGMKITLRDESDFELAIETAWVNSRGVSEGKIEVWCADV